MVADGSPNPTTTFQTQVNVEPNTDYKFSVELTNVNSSPYFIDSWRPIFQFSVNGDILGSPITVIRDCCSWNRFYQIWNSSNNTHATISIINLNISSEGNDFGLDNVSLRKICKAYDTINIVINNSSAFTEIEHETERESLNEPSANMAFGLSNSTGHNILFLCGLYIQ